MTDHPDFNILRALRHEYAERQQPRQCAEHGEFTVTVYSNFGESTVLGEIGKCPQCEEARRAAEQAEAEAMERRLAAQEFRDSIEASGLPRAFWSASFDGYEASSKSVAALAAVREWCSNLRHHLRTGRCLMLLGSPGVGKTHLGNACLLHARRNGFQVRYTTASDAVRAIRATWRRDSRESETDALRRFTEPHLLMIDEVGSGQSASDSELGLLSEIIDQRYRDHRPTIVAGNVNAKALEMYLGERAVDRLVDHGGVIVPMAWSSYRRNRPASKAAA